MPGCAIGLGFIAKTGQVTQLPPYAVAERLFGLSFIVGRGFHFADLLVFGSVGRTQRRGLVGRPSVGTAEIAPVRIY